MFSIHIKPNSANYSAWQVTTTWQNYNGKTKQGRPWGKINKRWQA